MKCDQCCKESEICFSATYLTKEAGHVTDRICVKCAIISFEEIPEEVVRIMRIE